MDYRDALIAGLPDSASIQTNAANAANVVTLAAPVDSAGNPDKKRVWIIVSVSASVAAAALAVGSFTIVSNSITKEQIELPASAYPPLLLGGYYVGEPGQSVVITQPPAGGTTRATLVVRAKLVPSPF